MWARPEEGSKGDQRIFDFGTNDIAYFALMLHYDGAGRSTRRCAITANYRFAERSLAAPGPRMGVWTHLAVTLSGTLAKLFVNGAVVDSSDHFAVAP
ncbi:LamG-like jellyroll fold domain-containing protein [Roseateles sp. 22389]|uniref:LamG-like jellyroll fold domain-containing protein n=1 Tax=Roseateles sp. 22389 TaxID=3453916 RepID=UPI003F86EE15